MNPGASDETTLDVAALTVNWDLEVGTFTSITGYAAYDTERQSNSDIAATASLNRQLEEDYSQFSQLILATGAKPVVLPINPH